MGAGGEAADVSETGEGATKPQSGEDEPQRGEGEPQGRRRGSHRARGDQEEVPTPREK